jgi:phosphoserine aminotransferase
MDVEEERMSRVYNFNPGPSTLPLPVLEKAQEELVEYQGKGMSILEMSHRSPEYTEVHNRATALLKELLEIPDDFTILFLAGGATLQFSMVPFNLLGGGKSCDFTLTGRWALKAYADASKIGKVNVVYDGEASNYSTLPDPSELTLDPDAAYLHLTSNETIGGVQWHEWPDAGDVPFVCDASSDLLSRPLPLEKFGIIYAGAQKNLGPAGTTVVIIRNDLLEACADDLTAYLSYKIHAKKGSLYNTPPVFAIYMSMLGLEWLEEQGGLPAAQQRAETRWSLLNDAIEGSGGFFRTPVPAHCRSRMNVVFRLPTEELERQFIAEAKERGLHGLKGHRSVGGCRASIYNAMPIEGAEALSAFMNEFAAEHG